MPDTPPKVTRYANKQETITGDGEEKKINWRKVDKTDEKISRQKSEDIVKETRKMK